MNIKSFIVGMFVGGGEVWVLMSWWNDHRDLNEALQLLDEPVDRKTIAKAKRTLKLAINGSRKAKA